MNKKQKMIRKMYLSYVHDMKSQNKEINCSYERFKRCYLKESFKTLYGMKEWFKKTKILD